MTATRTRRPYSVTGVNGETAAAGGSVNVSGTTHTEAGTYNGDAWSFTGGTNYSDAQRTVNDSDQQGRRRRSSSRRTA